MPRCWNGSEWSTLRATLLGEPAECGRGWQLKPRECMLSKGLRAFKTKKALKQYLGWCEMRRVLACKGLKSRRCSGIGSDTIEICSFRLNVNCSCTLECDIGNKSKYSMRLHCWAAISACCSWQLLPGEKSRKHLDYKQRIKVYVSSARRISLSVSLYFSR